MRLRESDQLKTVLELYDMEIHQKDIDAQVSEVEDDGEKKHRPEWLRYFDARNERIETAAVVWFFSYVFFWFFSFFF